MNRIERWLRIHVLRQKPEWHQVSLAGITVVPMGAEFVAGRNTDDLSFGPLEAGGTITGVWVGDRYFDLGDRPTSGGETIEIDLSDDGWFRI